MLGEFLSSNVSVPYALFMVKGMCLLIEQITLCALLKSRFSPGFGFLEEADAAFWTGILGKGYLTVPSSADFENPLVVAMFFLSQFLTSLLWVSICLL
jgi:hypothetical protein